GGGGGGGGGSTTGGPSQPIYRAMSGGANTQKRAAPGGGGGGGGMPRMGSYVSEGGPSAQSVHIARGQSVGVGRSDMRPPFNTQRVAQRVMPGGQTNRVYMTQGGTGSGSASPSQGGGGGGDGGGPPTAQGGRMYSMPAPHTVRVGIQPPVRMGGSMAGNGGPPKRAHSIVAPPKTGNMLVARAGTSIGQMRGAQPMSRFPPGTTGGPTARMMNVVVRDGSVGNVMRGGGTIPSIPSGTLSIPPSSIQSRSIPPSSRSIPNPRPQSHLSQSTLNPTMDTPSVVPPSLTSSNPPSDTVLPSQGGPLPSITLSSSSSSSSFPNPSSHHSM
ncbi:hypothetical protein PENTCL1PPCAC_11713, partial [Pristionchus entomophagus]